MNVLFMTMSTLPSVEFRHIYSDLVRKFRDEGHTLYVVSPVERREKQYTTLIEKDGVSLLRVKTLNVKKTGLVEKAIGQIAIDYLYKKAIHRFLNGIQFDLVLYTTPPINLVSTIRFCKKVNPSAISYLLLKDIFPQNAVDLGLMSKSGIKGLIYRYYRKKEKALYAISDFIGCMSPANVDYLLKHNVDVAPHKVEVAPNSLELVVSKRMLDKDSIRKEYGLPTNKPVFIYGGNLGKPQGVPFIIDCLNANCNRIDSFIVIVGNGTEYHRLEQWYNSQRPSSVLLIPALPKDKYDDLVSACDIGLVFLDHRFSIPNFPSRMLSYLENKMPVLAATDPVSDMGKIAEINGFGYWCESNSVLNFTVTLDKMVHSDYKKMGEIGYKYLCDNYLVSNTYYTIIKHVQALG